MHRGINLVLHTYLAFYTTSSIIPRLVHGNMLRSMGYILVFLEQRREIESLRLARVNQKTVKHNGAMITTTLQCVLSKGVDSPPRRMGRQRYFMR